MLNADKIESLINNKIMKIHVFDTVTSTNDVARELCNTSAEPILVIADSQTNGRGRQGKSFFSPENSGLYFSFTYNTPSPAFDFTGLTCAVAVGVTRAIEKLTNLKPEIKWVNDIYLDGRKVAGILVQSVAENGVIKKVIIGVGVNISTVSFPDDIRDIAGSLGAELDRNILAAEIINNTYELLAKTPDSYLDEYRSKSNVIGKEIICIRDNVRHNALAVDIDPAGGLVVLENGEKTTLTSGEISLRFPLK